MVTTNTYRYPYGTIMSVVKEHKNKKGYYATVAETGHNLYVAKICVRKI